MKLHAPELAADRFDGGKRAVRTGANAAKTVGQRFDPIAVAHPHGEVFAGRKAGKQLRGRFQANGRPAVFAMAGRHHLATQEQAGELNAIANPQDGHIQAEDLRRDPGRALVIHGRWSTGQDDPRRLHGADAFEGQIERVDFRIHILLAHPARDELGVLRTEIENENDLLG